MSKLAIDGGSRLFEQDIQLPAWPPVKESTAKRLYDLYMKQNWSFYGPEELKFAADFAAYHDAKYGTFMNNGTVTLETALHVLGIGPGDEVIVPAWT